VSLKNGSKGQTIVGTKNKSPGSSRRTGTRASSVSRGALGGLGARLHAVELARPRGT
jgi:hypothetical protein